MDTSEDGATRFRLRMSQNLSSLSGGQQIREMQLSRKSAVVLAEHLLRLWHRARCGGEQRRYEQFQFSESCCPGEGRSPHGLLHFKEAGRGSVVEPERKWQQNPSVTSFKKYSFLLRDL